MKTGSALADVVEVLQVIYRSQVAHLALAMRAEIEAAHRREQGAGGRLARLMDRCERAYVNSPEAAGIVLLCSRHANPSRFGFDAHQRSPDGETASSVAVAAMIRDVVAYARAKGWGRSGRSAMASAA